MAKEVGKSKDAGYQFGLRKTFALSKQQVWDFMFSEEGLAIWLGELTDDLELKNTYHTKEGVEGLVRVFEPDSHVRMSWKKKEWKNSSTVQVRIIPKAQNKTVISFLHEKLTNAKQRLEMKAYWNDKMSRISELLEKTDS